MMRNIVEGPPAPGDHPPPLWKRLAWFVAIAVAGTGATAIVAYTMKALLPEYPHG